MADLIEHLESFLGTMSGASRGDDSTPPGVQVAWFRDAPFAGVTTLVTVGLSRRRLGVPDGGSVHQELMMHVPNGDYPAQAAGLLFQLAGEMVRRGSALRPAQLIGPREPLFPGSRLTTMVATSPVYLPEGFAVCRGGASAPVVLAWLVPISGGEAEVIRRDGWAALEEMLVAQDPNLADPGRPEVALTGRGSGR